MKLFGMAQAIAELAEQRGPAFQKAQPLLNDLLKAEVAEREVRSINYHMKAAKFPAYRDLSGFTFADSAVDETLVKTLHSCAFIEDAHNVVFIGGPGTGKTHLATAIGVQAIMHHQLRVRCFSAIELVNQLERRKNPRQARANRQPARPCRPRYPRRARLPAVLTGRRGAVVPSAEHAL